MGGWFGSRCAISATLHVKEVHIPPSLWPALILVCCPDSCTPHGIMCCDGVVLSPFLLSDNETLERGYSSFNMMGMPMHLLVGHTTCSAPPPPPKKKAADGTPPAIWYHLVCHVVVYYDLMAAASWVWVDLPHMIELRWAPTLQSTCGAALPWAAMPGHQGALFGQEEPCVPFKWVPLLIFVCKKTEDKLRSKYKFNDAVKNHVCLKLVPLRIFSWENKKVIK